MVSHYRMARATAEAGLMRLVGALAVILPCLALVQVLANSHDYRQPAAAIGVWLGVLGAGAWLVPRLRRGALPVGETVAAIAIALVAVSAIGLAHRPHGTPGNADLAVLGTAWLLVLVVISRPAWVWVPAALLVFVVHAAAVIHDDGLGPLSESQLTVAAYVLAAILIAFASFRPSLAAHASTAARQASLASRLAAERAAAVAIGQERRGRLTVLEQEALPLLRGVAGGALDPAAASVREQCARLAAVLRHSVGGHVPRPGGLVATLEPSLRAARDRGLLVTVQVIGDLGVPQPRVGRAVTETVDAALSALPAEEAMLTALGSVDDIELYLSFAPAPRPAPDLKRFGLGLPAAARWHAALVETEAGGGYLEVSWRKEHDT